MHFQRAPKDVIKYSPQYERALAALIQMIAPMAPHFASELWSQFRTVPGRLHADDRADLVWDRDVLQQHWPIVDADYKLDLVFKVNGTDVAVGKYTAAELHAMTADRALAAAMECEAVKELVADAPIESSSYVHYAECEAIVSLSVNRRRDKAVKVKAKVKQ